jgi:sugar phosphate isomerase/epimerase
MRARIRMSSNGPAPDRLSINQITTPQWTIAELADACVSAGIRHVGLWRDKIHETGLAEAARVVKESGLSVSSICRGGMFPYSNAADRRRRREDNRRAVDEAAELGADVLVLVCGAPGRNTLDVAREMVEEEVSELLPYAQECRVPLGLEPLHPAFAAERSVLVTLEQANDLIDRFGHPPGLGVVVDTYNVWWDPKLDSEIARAAGRTLGLHVSDWLVPTHDPLHGRGFMGDGVIDIASIRDAVDRAGYAGAIEVEIFNRDIWDLAGEEAIEIVKRCFRDST